MRMQIRRAIGVVSEAIRNAIASDTSGNTMGDLFTMRKVERNGITHLHVPLTLSLSSSPMIVRVDSNVQSLRNKDLLNIRHPTLPNPSYR